MSVPGGRVSRRRLGVVSPVVGDSSSEDSYEGGAGEESLSVSGGGCGDGIVFDEAGLGDEDMI
jgi:hypothetical protein